MVANESTLPTAKLVETVRNMLRLINYELNPASPAQADVIYRLSKVFTTSFELIGDNAQVATETTTENAPIYYEANILNIDRTDQHSYVLAEENGAFTDYTTEANSETTPADDFTPWSTPVFKDAIYWGHKQIMWDVLKVVLTTNGANISGVWEFYDGDWNKTIPSDVTDLGTTLEFDVNSLLGPNNRQGTKIRIKLNSTATYEDVFSTWNGSKNIATTTSLLGQTTPSVDENDYTIGSDWTILEVDDETNDFTGNGEISYVLPQTIDLNWIKNEVDGKEAYWLRYRITSTTTPTAPVVQYTKMDTGKQYAHRLVTQGRTQTEDPLGSSTGLDDQTFELSKDYFLWDTETITADSEVYERVDNFLNSTSTDKHYVVELGENDRATIKFGGGGKGKVPAIGVGNVSAVYRYGGNVDGNVGANKIVIDKTGLTFIDKVWNPRQAVGWSEADGASEASLERAKIEGPASLRTREVALGPDDVKDMTKLYEDDDGARPFERAVAVEEGYGPKTIELIVMAKGGGYATADQLNNIMLYFNGDKYAYPPLPQRIIANQQVIATNYQQKSIDITATVYGNIEKESIENRLTQLIQPNALKEDGVTYEWDFGEKIEVSRLIHEIFDISPDVITKVVITIPASEIQLQDRELPIIGTLNITVVEPS